jgi:phospholipid N-methyltransferase
MSDEEIGIMASNDQEDFALDARRAALWRSALHFLWAGLVNRGQTGGVVPSQRFLIARMIDPVPPTYRGRIVELGAGTGALTLRLAARCPAAQILACEINPTLARDNRNNLRAAGVAGQVELVADSAEQVLSEIRAQWAEKPAYIISGIPLGNLRADRARSLIESISRSLKADGMYIQFQHSLMDRKKVAAAFPKLRTVAVLLNFPPAVVYYAQK